MWWALEELSSVHGASYSKPAISFSGVETFPPLLPLLLLWTLFSDRAAKAIDDILISEVDLMPGIFYIVSRTGSMRIFKFVAVAYSFGAMDMAEIAFDCT